MEALADSVCDYLVGNPIGLQVIDAAYALANDLNDDEPSTTERAVVISFSYGIGG
jgi:hypothetical protein